MSTEHYVFLKVLLSYSSSIIKDSESASKKSDNCQPVYSPYQRKEQIPRLGKSISDAMRQQKSIKSLLGLYPSQ